MARSSIRLLVLNVAVLTGLFIHRRLLHSTQRITEYTQVSTIHTLLTCLLQHSIDSLVDYVYF